jgi:mRNA-degrading endonuclease RelE of RelBE toxin-antitoxin system
MFQIVFNETSAAELAALPKKLQLQIMGEFNVNPDNLADAGTYGRLKREGRQLYRYRAGDYRIYFEKTGDGILVHRVVHRNTLKDFLFRTKLPVSEDEVLEENPKFWDMVFGGKKG